MAQIVTFPTPRRVLGVQPVQPEIVATLLLALEEAPLTPLVAAATRVQGGGFAVLAVAGGRPFHLRPDDARLAAHALFAEQAFVGCVEASARLMDAARTADAMLDRGAA